jgi:hypothetical protein
MGVCNCKHVQKEEISSELSTDKSGGVKNISSGAVNPKKTPNQTQDLSSDDKKDHLEGDANLVRSKYILNKMSQKSTDLNIDIPKREKAYAPSSQACIDSLGKSNLARDIFDTLNSIRMDPEGFQERASSYQSKTNY